MYDSEIVLIQVTFGITEPICEMFANVSLGSYALTLCFTVLSFFAMNMYNSNFRATLIGQSISNAINTFNLESFNAYDVVLSKGAEQLLNGMPRKH